MSEKISSFSEEDLQKMGYVVQGRHNDIRELRVSEGSDASFKTVPVSPLVTMRRAENGRGRETVTIFVPIAEIKRI